MLSDLRLSSCALAHNISHEMSDHYMIHSHPFYELYYFVSGDVKFIYSGAEYVMQPHTLIVVAPNVFHGIHVLSTKTYDRFTYHFTEDFITLDRRQLLMGALPTETTIRQGSSTIPHIIPNAESLGFLPLMREVENLIPMPKNISGILASSIVETMLGLLLLHKGDRRAAANISSYYSDYQELQPVLSYIHQNLTDKITLDILSQYAHISKSKLNQLFRQHLGTSVMEYVIRRRLNYAQQLLISGVSAVQASVASGFGDYTNFYRAYVKQMGHSPIDDKRTVNDSSVIRLVQGSNENMDQRSIKKVNVTQDQDIWALHKATNISDPSVLVDP